MAKHIRQHWDVYLDASELGPLGRVGSLFRHSVRTDIPASFEYDVQWLQGGHAFMLDPNLALWRGEQHPPIDLPAFGVFMDSAPDRWGRVLIERREAARARRDGRKMRMLQEIDYLLGVDDHTRMGALRFCDPDTGTFIDESENAAPPVTDLKELAYISRRVEEPGVEELPEYERWLAMLVAPGSSLGGARPKANFTDSDGTLWIAKFPAKDDRYDVGGWEYVVQVLAKQAGIEVQPARPERFTGQYTTFCTRRFDRVGAHRRMYASAMTLLERRDGQEGGSYLDLVELISDKGARGHLAKDLEQLFRRVMFNVLIGNRDDHLRNHGFIRELTGWRLSPAFDVNPSVAKQDHTLTLDGKHATPEVGLVMATADLYRLKATRAQEVFTEVRTALGDWKAVAQRHGLGGIEIHRMEAVIQA